MQSYTVPSPQMITEYKLIGVNTSNKSVNHYHEYFINYLRAASQLSSLLYLNGRNYPTSSSLRRISYGPLLQKNNVLNVKNIYSLKSW